MASHAQASEPIYQTITGGHMPLSGLSEAEYGFLDIVARKYSPKQDWTRFAAWWNARFNASGLPISSVVYRICQDLGARLGPRTVTDVTLPVWKAAGLRVPSMVRLSRLDCLEQSLLIY